MNNKQRRFAEEYMIDSNATQAAIRAGYSAKTANEQGARLLANVSVAAAIQAAQIEVSERTKVTVDDVVVGLLAEAEGKDDSTAGARVTAWAQLGKHLGMDRRDINLRLERTPADEMSPDELEAELARINAEHMAIMSPAQAKAEIQRLHGNIAELEVIARHNPQA